MYYKNSAMQWFPPAETKIPLSALSGSFHSDLQTAEHDLCFQLNTAYCLLGPSGRALLYNLLVGLYEKSGKTRNEVLIPAYTCYSVAASVVKAGLKIRLYDLDTRTFDPVTASLEKNLNVNTLAILSQHLMGNPSNVDDVASIAASENLYHIEDAAQALGGRIKEKYLGTTGDYGIFSFGRGKPLPLGAGGALISNKYDFGEMPFSFTSNSGWKSLLMSFLIQLLAYPYLYGIMEHLPLGLGRTVFDPDFKISHIPRYVMGLLSPMLRYLKKLNDHRLAVASIYQRIIPATHAISYCDGGIPVYPRFPVLAKPGSLPQDLRRFGVRRLYPKSLNRETPITAHILNLDQRFPGAERLAQCLISLPTHHFIDSNLADSIGLKTKQWINT